MIRKKFGEEAEFDQILGEYFSSRKSDTTKGNYIQLHKLIAQLPFRAIVTTNYDPGIWNAFLAYRKDACATLQLLGMVKTPFISGGAVIYLKRACVPFSIWHGSWTYPSTIVLDSDRYRAVYNADYFDKMFKDLWEQKSLIIIGYGYLIHGLIGIWTTFLQVILNTNTRDTLRLLD